MKMKKYFSYGSFREIFRMKSRIFNLYGSLERKLPYEIGKVLFVRQKKEKLPYEIGKLKSIRQLADLAAV